VLTVDLCRKILALKTFLKFAMYRTVTIVAVPYRKRVAFTDFWTASDLSYSLIYFFSLFLV